MDNLTVAIQTSESNTRGLPVATNTVARRHRSACDNTAASLLRLTRRRRPRDQSPHLLPDYPVGEAGAGRAGCGVAPRGAQGAMAVLDQPGLDAHRGCHRTLAGPNCRLDRPHRVGTRQGVRGHGQCDRDLAVQLTGLAITASWLGGWWLDPVIGLGIAAAAVWEGIQSWSGEKCEC
jgi:hypothetical protein